MPPGAGDDRVVPAAPAAEDHCELHEVAAAFD